MKRKIADYIEKFLTTGKSLTDSQAKIIAYWELVDFQCDDSEPAKQYHDVLRKFMEDYNNEVFTLVQGEEKQGTEIVHEVERREKEHECCA